MRRMHYLEDGCAGDALTVGEAILKIALGLRLPATFPKSKSNSQNSKSLCSSADSYRMPVAVECNIETWQHNIAD